MVQRTLQPIYVSVSFLSPKIEKALLRLQYDENVNAGLIDCMIMIMMFIGGGMMMMVLEMMAMRVLKMMVMMKLGCSAGGQHLALLKVRNAAAFNNIGNFHPSPIFGLSSYIRLLLKTDSR